MTQRFLLLLACLAFATPVYAQRQTQGALSATGSVVLDVTGQGTASVSVSGTYTGTISFEISNGLAAQAVNCVPPDDATVVTSTTSTGSWACSVAGFTQFIARMSSYTSGTANIVLSAAPGGGGSGSGGATEISGDAATNLSTIATNMTTLVSSAAVDGTHANTVPNTGPTVTHEAASDVSANTAVADGDAVRATADLIGRAIIVGPCDRGGRVGGVTTITDGSSTSAIAAQGAGVYIEVWDVIASNTSATATSFDIRDGTAGSVIAKFPAPANDAGVVHRLAVPITSSANTAIAIDPDDAVTSLVVTLRGCKAK